MNPMSATVRAIFYTLAVLCFAVAALARGKGPAERVDLIAAGLGLFVFVYAYDSWAVS